MAMEICRAFPVAFYLERSILVRIAASVHRSEAPKKCSKKSD